MAVVRDNRDGGFLGIVPEAPSEAPHVHPLYNYNTHYKYGDGIEFTHLPDVMNQNGFFNLNDQQWYNKFHRYGWVDPYDHDRVTREFVFFTKPDCNIFLRGDDSGIILNPDLASNPVIKDTAERRPWILSQLQQDITPNGFIRTPFMNLLSNGLNSKLDIPSISVDSTDSTPNIMGTSIQYRGHSFKGGGTDFSLSFHDTQYLEIYMLAKCYDEYMKWIKLGDASPKFKYIENHIISDQFSVYKIDVGSDGETILFWAKITGCYFTDVPRDTFSDPPEDGFKFALSFHGHFVEDMNPQILAEINAIVSRYYSYNDSKLLPVYDATTMGVNNDWGTWPRIMWATKTGGSTYDKRVDRRQSNKEYFLKWYSA